MQWGGRTCALWGAVQGMAEALICLFGMALHRGVFSWPVNAVPEEEQLQGQWLRLQAVHGWGASPEPQPCCAPAAPWVQRERRVMGGVLLVYSTFIFMEALIGLWYLWNAEGGWKKKPLKLFAGQENISRPALKGLPREIFFCLYFSLMSQAPKNVLFHIQSDILTYICLTIWHTYWF